MHKATVLVLCLLCIHSATCCITNRAICDCQVVNGRTIINCQPGIPGRSDPLTSVPLFTPDDITYDELTLARNHITEIEPYAFYNVSVKRLDLSQNRIISVQENAFTGIRDLEELILWTDRLDELDPDGSLSALQGLRVLHLQSFNAGSIGDAGVPDIPSLQTLKLDNCGITNIQSLTFEQYSELTTLELSNNPLNTKVFSSLAMLPELTVIRFDNISQTSIRDNSFINQTHLVELDLSGNMIRNLTQNAFLGAHYTLKMLNLNNNQLAGVFLQAFHNLQSLEELYLGHNSIEEVPRNALNSLYTLRTLHLQNNDISTINSSISDTFPSNIETLVLAENKIHAVGSQSFMVMDNLLHLDLSHQDSFKVLLSYDSFTGIDGTLLELNLARTRFEAQWESLAELAQLRSLDLSENNITYIPENAFIKMERLAKLYLGSNDLLVITQYQLNGLRFSLHILDVQNNQISSLDECVFHGFENISSNYENLHLSGNPLVCDCELFWLYQEVQEMTLLQQFNIRWQCQGPPEHSNKPITSTELYNDAYSCEVQANCTDIWVTVPAVTQTTTQEVVTVPDKMFNMTIANVTSDSARIYWVHSGYRYVSTFLLTYKVKGSETYISEKYLFSSYTEQQLTNLSPGTDHVVCVTLQYHQYYDGPIEEEELCDDFTTLQDPVTQRRVDNSNDAGLIAGVTIGVCLVIILVIIAICCFLRYKRKEDEKNNPKHFNKGNLPTVAYNSKRYTKPAKLDAINAENKKNILIQKGLENLSDAERDKIIQVLNSSADPLPTTDPRWSQTSTASNPRYVQDPQYMPGVSPFHHPPQLPPRPNEGYLDPVDLRDDPENHLYAEIPHMGDIRECHI